MAHQSLETKIGCGGDDSLHPGKIKRQLLISREPFSPVNLLIIISLSDGPLLSRFAGTEGRFLSCEVAPAGEVLYVLYRDFKKNLKSSNGLVLQFICHCRLQQRYDQTQSACRKPSPNPHQLVKTKFSKDIVQQENKGSLLNPSMLTTV